MSFATKNIQNRSQEWNLDAAKLRLSDIFAKINPKTANFGPKMVYLVIFYKMSWLTLSNRLRWVLLPKVVKTDPKSAAKHKQSNGSAIIGPKTANFGPKVVFLVIFNHLLVFLAYLAPCPTKKEKSLWVSLWWCTKTFLTNCHNCDSWPKDSRFCLKIAIFSYF